MNTGKIVNIVSCLFMMASAAGAAETKITDRNEIVTEKLPRPDHVWVYDFAATAADLPAESALAGNPDVDTTPPTDEDLATGKQLGAEIATELVSEISDMGLSAELTSDGTKPQINDIVIRGAILSIKQGDAKQRIGIGFGKGDSELKTAVEGFQMTDQGLRKLGSADLDAKGSKTPGVAVGAVMFAAKHNPLGLIVSGAMKVHGEKSGSSEVGGRAKQTAAEIAVELKKRFQEQGWIQ